MPVLFLLQSVEGITNASMEDLVLCPGLGPQKVSRIKKKKKKNHKGLNIQHLGRWNSFQLTVLKMYFFFFAGEASL